MWLLGTALSVFGHAKLASNPHLNLSIVCCRNHKGVLVIFTKVIVAKQNACPSASAPQRFVLFRKVFVKLVELLL